MWIISGRCLGSLCTSCACVCKHFTATWSSLSGFNKQDTEDRGRKRQGVRDIKQREITRKKEAHPNNTIFVPTPPPSLLAGSPCYRAAAAATEMTVPFIWADKRRISSISCERLSRLQREGEWDWGRQKRNMNKKRVRCSKHQAYRSPTSLFLPAFNPTLLRATLQHCSTDKTMNGQSHFTV